MVTVVTWMCIQGCGPSCSRSTSALPSCSSGTTSTGAFLHLDLGTSWENNQPPVAGMLREGLPADLWLLAGGMAFGLLVGVSAGA